MRSPDHWQAEALRSFAVDQRIAIKSAKGPGKTTLLAWCGWNFLVTREHCNIAAMSISGDNLGNGFCATSAACRGNVRVLIRSTAPRA